MAGLRAGMFRGTQQGRVDDKHRLCFPATVRRKLKEAYGSTAVFITSLDGEEVKVFPIREWEKIEARLGERPPDAKPQEGQRKKRFLFLANHYGQEGSLDNQGRVLIPGPLREGPGMKGDVMIVWQSTHMLVMGAEKYKQKTIEYQLSDEDLADAENLGL